MATVYLMSLFPGDLVSFISLLPFHSFCFNVSFFLFEKGALSNLLLAHRVISVCLCQDICILLPVHSYTQPTWWNTIHTRKLLYRVICVVGFCFYFFFSHLFLLFISIEISRNRIKWFLHIALCMYVCRLSFCCVNLIVKHIEIQIMNCNTVVGDKWVRPVKFAHKKDSGCCWEAQNHSVYIFKIFGLDLPLSKRHHHTLSYTCS